MARTVACPACGHVLTGKDDQELFRLSRQHGDTVHKDMPRMTDEQIWQVIRTGARDVPQR